MRELRRTLETIVTLVLATGCGGGEKKVQPTGGGCDGMRHSYKQEAPLDDKLRAAIEACTTKPACPDVCGAIEGVGTQGDCQLETSPDPAVVVVTYSTPVSCPGRRPRTAARTPRAIRSAGELLARQAELEALSVPAFEELARALAVHAAPRALIDAAEEAAADEVRHAAACKSLARRFGGVPRVRRPKPSPVPTLEQLAIDNVVEGEVRETWGAVVATWQAQTAGDDAVRTAMTEIARDETQHAELAAQIGAWVHARLDDAARARVAAARAAAIEELAAAVHGEPPPIAVAALGVPDAAAATRLFGALRATVWA